VEHRTARAGAVAVRVPVEGGVQAPVAVEAVLVLQCIRRGVGGGLIAGAVIDAGQLYLAVFEVERLANADALALEAIGFDPAAGQTQRQLVLVTDAVLAAEAVFPPQRG